MFRRIAANRVVVNGHELRQCIVEIKDGIVVNHYPFSDELPFTEWLGGVIEIMPDDKGNPVALWNGREIR